MHDCSQRPTAQLRTCLRNDFKRSIIAGMFRQCLVYLILAFVSFCSCRRNHRKTPESTKKDQLERLIAQNIYGKRLLFNSTCVKKNRQCLADHVQSRLWHKQGRVNKALNRGLNISNENNYIHEVLQMMLEDNADTFRDINEDDIRLSKYLINKHRKKMRRKSRNHKRSTRKKQHLSRSTIPDFVDTHALNDFLHEFSLFIQPKKLSRKSAIPENDVNNRNESEKALSNDTGDIEVIDLDYLNDTKIDLQANKSHDTRPPDWLNAKHKSEAENTTHFDRDLDSQENDSFVNHTLYKSETKLEDKQTNINETHLLEQLDNNTTVNKENNTNPHVNVTNPSTNKTERNPNNITQVLYKEISDNVTDIQNPGNVTEQQTNATSVVNENSATNNEDLSENSVMTNLTETQPPLNDTDAAKISAVNMSSTHENSEQLQVGSTVGSNETNTQSKGNETSLQPGVTVSEAKPCYTPTVTTGQISIQQSSGNCAEFSGMVSNITVMSPNDTCSPDNITCVQVNIANKNNNTQVFLNSNKISEFFASEESILGEKRNKLRKAGKSRVSKNKKAEESKDNENKLNGIALTLDEQIVALESGWDLEDRSKTPLEDDNSTDPYDSSGDLNVFYNDASKDFYKEFDQVVKKNTEDNIKEERTGVEHGHKAEKDRNLDKSLTSDRKKFVVKKRKEKKKHKGNKINGFNYTLNEEEEVKHELTIQSHQLAQIDKNRRIKETHKKGEKDHRQKEVHITPTTRQLYGGLSLAPEQLNWNDYVVNTAQQQENTFQEDYNDGTSYSGGHINFDPSAPLPTISMQMTLPQATVPVLAPYQPPPNYLLTTPTTLPKTRPTSPIPTPKKIPGWATDIPDGKIKAARVCKPGPIKPPIGGLHNCLIIGDSIALGYSYSVAAALKDHCQVQLAPSSKAGVALDSSYGLQCLDMFLAPVDLTPTFYDIIVFNFGLHDIDYLKKYPEEYNNIDAYASNIRKIKKRLLATGATIAFALSTPVTFNKDKDDLLKKYNHVAKRIMEEKPRVLTVNLHKLVTKECGHAPFENCYMMKKPHDVHYGVTGSIMLGKRIAFAMTYLFDKRKKGRKGKPPVPKKIIDLSANATFCHSTDTLCPSGTSCMSNIVSRSGSACCKHKHGVDCGDSWHCCPKGSICHPACSDLKCTCMKG